MCFVNITMLCLYLQLFVINYLVYIILQREDRDHRDRGDRDRGYDRYDDSR